MSLASEDRLIGALLDALCAASPPGGPLGRMFAAGLAGVRADRTRHQPGRRPSPPVPGGLLRGRVDSAACRYLAYRVLIPPTSGLASS
jgi:hypothetical protein